MIDGTTMDIILILCLVVSALWTVMTTRLIRSVVGLAITSVVLTIIMFRLLSPLAAVFELSVCAGLISVIFITTVSFTHRVSAERLIERQKERWHKFWLLPLILVVVGALMLVYKLPKIDFVLPQVSMQSDVRDIMWNMRHLDILGQIIIILVGAFSVAVFFKEKSK